MKDFQALVSLASGIIHDCQVCLNNALKGIGLGSAEANVLMFLYGGGDGGRQDDIVAATEVSKPAISRTVASLEAKGYVIREPGSTDKRSRMVRLTEKARQIQPLVEQQYSDLVSAAARGIPEDKVAEFMAMFSQVARNVGLYRETIRDSRDGLAVAFGASETGKRTAYSGAGRGDQHDGRDGRSRPFGKQPGQAALGERGEGPGHGAKR